MKRNKKYNPKQVIMGMSLRCVGNVKRSVNVKANEFVKKYGIEAAIDLWCGAFDLYSNNLQILNGMVCSFSGNQFLFELVDIKRLVESHELVEEYGGLDKAKAQAERFRLNTCIKMHGFMCRIIADVESCQ